MDQDIAIIENLTGTSCPFCGGYSSAAVVGCSHCIGRIPALNRNNYPTMLFIFTRPKEN